MPENHDSLAQSASEQNPLRARYSYFEVPARRLELFFQQVKSIREVTQPSGEKAVVPEVIACSWTDRELDPNFDPENRDLTEPSLLKTFECTGREFEDLEVDTDLKYHRARCFDPRVGRWLSDDPLGCDQGEGDLFKYPE